MAKKTSNEVAVKQQTAVSTEVNNTWGSEGLNNSDMLVPKLLVMQGLSKLVGSGEASVGQIRDSLEGKLMGGKVKPKENPVPVQVIPFSTFKTWVIFEKRNGKDEYVKTVPITSENESWPINEVVNGVEVRRDKCLNFYVIALKDIEEQTVFPYLVSFRRTSMQAGKKLATLAAKNRVFNKPLAANIIDLNVAFTKNDKGEFYVFDVAQGRATSAEELSTAKEWHEAFKANAANIKHDDSDLKAESNAASSSVENTDY